MHWRMGSSSVVCHDRQEDVARCRCSTVQKVLAKTCTPAATRLDRSLLLCLGNCAQLCQGCNYYVMCTILLAMRSVNVTKFSASSINLHMTPADFPKKYKQTATVSFKIASGVTEKSATTVTMSQSTWRKQGKTALDQNKQGCNVQGVDTV